MHKRKCAKEGIDGEKDKGKRKRTVEQERRQLVSVFVLTIKRVTIEVFPTLVSPSSTVLNFAKGALILGLNGLQTCFIPS